MAQVPIPNTKITREDPIEDGGVSFPKKRLRYKREKCQVVPIGQNQLFKNFGKICKQLEMKKEDEVDFLANYFKKELKQTVIQSTGTLRFKTVSKDPEEILEKFIDEYLLCKRCESFRRKPTISDGLLPELNDNRVCRSCGSSN